MRERLRGRLERRGDHRGELKDRRILGEEGFISIFAVVDSTSGKVLAGPTIHARGVAEGDDVFDQILPDVERALEEAVVAGTFDPQQLQQVVRRVVGRWRRTGCAAAR